MGDSPNSVLCSVYVSRGDGSSKLISEDPMSFYEVGMNEESSCSCVEEDWCVDNFVLFFCLACNRKGDGE